MSEVVGLFNSRNEAETAADELLSRGYDAESLGYLDRHRDERGEVIVDPEYDVEGHETHSETGEEAGKGMAGGAVGGAATGAGAALLASAGLLVVPGVGPFLAAGTIAGVLGATAVGAAGGAVVGGAAGAVVGASTDDDPDDETSAYYRRGIDQGKAMVTVEVGDGQEAEVGDILRSAGADRVDTYGDDGWLD